MWLELGDWMLVGWCERSRPVAVRAVLWAICLPLAVGCAPPPAPGELAPGMEPLLSSTQVYTTGDGVRFVLQVTNTTTSALELTFPTGQTYDFVVRQNGREFWRWSQGQAFTQAVQQVRLGPGETIVREAQWSAPPSARGEFEATGILTTSEYPVEQTARFELR